MIQKQTSSKNEDLIWDLGKIQHKNRAKNFVKLFEKKLCVYSSAVKQIYTNYNIFFPEGANKQMVILPDPYAFHDTFNHIDTNAICETGLYIIPGALIGRKGLYLIISYKNKDIKSVPIPFKEGMKQILRRTNSQEPFLPVLVKGDLREFNESLPSIHLHRIRSNRLKELSGLERESLRRIMTEKLMSLYQESGRI